MACKLARGMARASADYCRCQRQRDAVTKTAFLEAMRLLEAADPYPEQPVFLYSREAHLAKFFPGRKIIMIADRVPT